MTSNHGAEVVLLLLLCTAHKYVLCVLLFWVLVSVYTGGGRSCLFTFLLKCTRHFDLRHVLRLQCRSLAGHDNDNAPRYTSVKIRFSSTIVLRQLGPQTLSYLSPLLPSTIPTKPFFFFLSFFEAPAEHPAPQQREWCSHRSSGERHRRVSCATGTACGRTWTSKEPRAVCGWQWRLLLSDVILVRRWTRVHGHRRLRDGSRSKTTPPLSETLPAEAARGKVAKASWASSSTAASANTTVIVVQVIYVTTAISAEYISTTKDINNW